MLKTLTVKGFRCFRELRVEPLTRVNLFVGMNSAGKTSILDATELLAIGRLQGLVRSAIRRGERVLADSEDRGEFREHVVDPSHLFYGHELRKGASFSIVSGRQHWFRCTVEANSDWALVFESHFSPGAIETLTISPSGGVLPPPSHIQEPSPRVNFLGTESMDVTRMGQLWDALVLTPEEDGITAALRLIEPRVERLAFLSKGRSGSANVLVKLAEIPQRVPLGSLGGGMGHLLALVLHLFSAKGGVLLVDEIDTGLHYSVMTDMWRLVTETAKRLDIQIFATTHSLDCVRALAQLRRQYPETAAEVTLHRVEKDSPTTVAYDADELVLAAQSLLEVR